MLFTRTSGRFRGNYYSANKQFIAPLPAVNIEFTTAQPERDIAVEKAVRDYANQAYQAVVQWAEQELEGTPESGYSGAGRNDTAHDLLSHLSERMTVMHKQRVAIERTWRDWVEAILPPNHELTKTFLTQGWVEVGLEGGWERVKAEFQARKAIPSGKTLQDLRRETEEALEKLRPRFELIRKTDELIDQIVYRLYGLTEDEIAVVEASTSGA
jgi:hypothetical protein